jgi:hypothetical protein
MGMTIDEINKEMAFAKKVIGLIDNVKTPMLMYDEEKTVTKRALHIYISELDRAKKVIENGNDD